MDILTHAISGTAVAACASSFVRTTPLRKIKILFIGTLGGILPDIDAISLWSKFDSTLGQWFNLSHSGKEIYSMKLWYSHRAFFHSLLASLIFSSLLILLIYLFDRKESKTERNQFFAKKYFIYFISFLLGYWVHLAGDLPTPSSAWGGIAFLWPSKEYIGGWGKIWWWNNYDIFLLILFSIVIMLLLPAISKYIQRKAKIFSTIIVITTLILITLQINTRQYDYSSEGTYAQKEQNSKKEQQRILGKRLYNGMAWFDSKMKFYF